MKSDIYHKGKLHLQKQAIVTLSMSVQDHIRGGQGEYRAWSTSIGKCSGIFCCDHDTPVIQPVSEPAHYILPAVQTQF